MEQPNFDNLEKQSTSPEIKEMSDKETWIDEILKESPMYDKVTKEERDNLIKRLLGYFKHTN
ncbi:MAG: hypothetical protein QMD86_01895 [Patescibacteria group bacterium]|nr:hypothetical protein [Patescibacteria group bacterium]